MVNNILNGIKTKFKTHKHWFIAALVLDILSIPAAAQIVDHVSFSVPEKVAAVQLDVQQDGLQRFVVASNGPFAIISENAIGAFNVQLTTKGDLNGQAIGSNAQLPGAEKNCAVATSQGPQKIYEAIRKTAKHRGEVLSQAVIVEISYDPVLNPDFKIITRKKSASFALAGNCQSV